MTYWGPLPQLEGLSTCTEALFAQQCNLFLLAGRIGHLSRGVALSLVTQLLIDQNLILYPPSNDSKRSSKNNLHNLTFCFVIPSWAAMGKGRDIFWEKGEKWDMREVAHALMQFKKRFIYRNRKGPASRYKNVQGYSNFKTERLL